MAAKRAFPRIDVEAVPDLEHWVSIPEAGVMLGMSRQRAYGWAAEGRFATLHRIRSGSGGATKKRAVFVVKRREVERLANKRAAVGSDT